MVAVRSGYPHEVIVVIGHPTAAVGPAGRQPAGTAALAALAAARAGAEVQLVGKVGDDDAGDELLLRLAREGVGHVALQRDPSRRTPVRPAPDEVEGLATVEAESSIAEELDPIAESTPAPALDAADIELALRYLSDFRGIVVAEPLPEAVVRVIADAAAYAGAALVLVTDDAADLAGVAPPGALVVAAATTDPDGVFAALLGETAAAIDRGEGAAAAFAGAAGRLGASRSE